jgi:hypothetical protein
MKKILVFCLAVACWSCQKENNENLKPKTTLADVSPQRAGDGVNDVIGYGYDVTGVYADASASRNAVIDIAAFSAANPNRLYVSYPNSQTYFSTYGVNARDFSSKLSKTITATAIYSTFTGSVNASTTETTTYSSKYLYGMYNLLLQRKQIQLNASSDLLRNYLTPEFLADLSNQTPAYIVNKYGTHVHVNIITGGKLEILYRSETTSSSRTEAATAGLKVSVAKVFDLGATTSSDVTNSKSNTNQSLTYHSVGGSVSVPLVTVNVEGASTVSFSAWQNSVTDANSVLVAIPADGLIDITELVADVTKKTALQTYIAQYITSKAVNITYNTAPLLSSYNAVSFDNLLSIAPETAGVSNWVQRGTIGQIFTDNSMEGTIPLYRYYFNNGTHFYTNNYNEIGAGGDWGHFEQIAGYIYSQPTAGAIPIYRYNSNARHWYTTDYNELGAGGYKGTVLNRRYYTYEGIVGYIKQ